MSNQDDLDVARRVAEIRGGVSEPPQVAQVEIRPPEVIYPAPLKEHGPITLPRQHIIVPQAGVGGLAHVKMAERREWIHPIWIHDSEQYDHEHNVLTLYGYWRIFRFDVWVEVGQEGERP